MKKTKLKMSFQLKKSRPKADGTMPIYLRITFNGDRFETTTKRSVVEKLWDNKMQKVKGNSEASQIINNYLDELRNQVNRFYNKNFNNSSITIHDFKSMFQGENSNAFTLLKVFKENNKMVNQGIGLDYSESTYNQYLTTFKRLKKFLKKYYNRNDIELAELDIKFIIQFENFIRTKYNLKGNTSTKYAKQLKKVVHYAMELHYIKFDPFYGRKTNYTEVDRGYLSNKELKKIEEKKFSVKRLEEVRDVFIFVCYTGFSYSDLKSFSTNNIVKGIDGNNWIQFNRKKTAVKSSFRILSPAQRILDKYANDPECVAYEKILPVKSNQRLNSYLSEIADICGIEKHITMHLGRHTFATTVALCNGVPIETVQQILGHKNLSTTQIYARVIDEKVAQDMNSLEEKLSNKTNLTKEDNIKKIS